MGQGKSESGPSSRFHRFVFIVSFGRLNSGEVGHHSGDVGHPGMVAADQLPTEAVLA